MRDDNALLPDYDFSDAFALSEQERLKLCLKALKTYRQDEVTFGVAPVPDAGATEAELREVERQNGEPLPTEYRAFLRHCGYLDLDDGLKIWGISHVDREGVSDSFSPWVSEDHFTEHPCWVIGDYWRYADGDQLLLLCEELDQPVVLYLHEHGPTLETFAPSFSLALWRIVHEECV